MAKSPPSTSVKVGNLFSKLASVANIKRKHFKTQMADLSLFTIKPACTVRKG